MDFGSALGAIVSGGATGLLGAGLQVLGTYITDRQKNKHQLEMTKLEMESMRMEAQFALSRTQAEAEASMNLAEQKSFEKSFEGDKATYTPQTSDPRIGWVLVWIDFIRGLVRPAITLWMAYLLVKLHNDLIKITGGVETMPATVIESLMQDVILTTLYIATSVILWWFGSRPPKMKVK